MTENQSETYPSIAQSFGIVGIVILGMLLFSPISLIDNEIINKEAATFIYYLLAVGTPLVIIDKIRKKKTNDSGFDLELDSPLTFILVAITTISFQLGVTGPIIWSIPMPEFIQKIFLELSDQNGIFSFLTIVIAAPILEEVIFRGIMLDGLLKLYSPLKSILLSSFLFGLIHLNPWQFISALVIGMFSGWIYYRTKKLTLSIAIHMANNLFAFVAMYATVAEEMMNKTAFEIYGGVINAIIIMAAAIVTIAVCIYVLNNKFNNEIRNVATQDSIIE